MDAMNDERNSKETIAWHEHLLKEERQRSEDLQSRLDSIIQRPDRLQSCTCGLFSTTIQDLPSEILGEIFQHLDIVEQVSARSVCKEWYNVLKSKRRLSHLTIHLANIPAHATRHHLHRLCNLTEDGTSLRIKGIPKRLLLPSSREPREFEFLTFTQICENLFNARPSLCHLVLTNSFVRLSWLVNRVPASVQTLVLENVVVMEPVTPGISYNLSVSCGIFVSKETVKLGTESRWTLSWSALDRHVAPLTKEEKHRLKSNLPRLPRNLALGAAFVIRHKEAAYRDREEDLDLQLVDPESLRPTTQHELTRMLLEAQAFQLDVSGTT